MAELVVVLFVVLLVFGSSKIPALGDGLGRAVSNFRDALKDGGKRSDKPGPP